MEKTTPVLLVTANVGSIFEDPSHMLKIWTEEFLSTVAKLDPKFIALHCQEVGGKNYERSMKHVEDFVRLFMSSEELRLFDQVRVFLDEDYSSAENFTALGNFYFIHESLSDVLIWDFAAMTFVPAKGKEVHSGNIEAVTTKEKSKFPQDFFPECKWSRKGFLRTRWSLKGTVFDLINIHLFHDASNFIAMESFPSVYSKNRQRALEHTLERFHNDSYGVAPFFVFGDFNFRTDTQGVVNKLVDGLSPVRVQSNKNNDHTKLQYKDDESQIVLSLGKKEFSHTDHQSVFLDENGMWLKEFDKEMESFVGRLFEFPINFPPSYPFEEDEKGGNNYMKTRCPAWCDRVLMSNTAKTLVSNASEPCSVEYGLMGRNTRMGDHKPVYLKMDLINDAGTVSCCTPCDLSSSDKRVLCFGKVAVCEAASWSCSSLSLKQGGCASSSALTLKLDTSAAALSAGCFLAPPHASLLHEPYTPESMETPSSSPVPLRIQRDFDENGDVDDEEEDDDGDDDENQDNGGRGDEILQSSIAKTLYSNLSEKLMYTKKKHSDFQELSSSERFISKSGFECSAKESSSKSAPDLAVVNNFGQSKLCQGVPHVFICYLDSQDSHIDDIDSVGGKCNLNMVMGANTNSSVHLKSVAQEESDTNYFEKELCESHTIDQSVSRTSRCIASLLPQESRTVLSSISVSCPHQEINDENSILKKNLQPPLLKQFTSDSSTLVTPLCTSYVPAVSSQNMMFRNSDDISIIECCGNVEYEIKKEFLVGDKKDSEKKMIPSESISDVNYFKNTPCLSPCNLPTIKNEQTVEKARENSSNCRVLIDANDIAATNTSKGSCSKFISADSSHSVNEIQVNYNEVEVKSKFPLNSPDCVNIISTEFSSQPKRKQNHKTQLADDPKFNRSSKKTCSSCCSII